MRKNLTAIGSSLGLIIDQSMVKRYQIDLDTVVEITPQEDGLNIRFIKECDERACDNDVKKAAYDINRRYNKMMKNLAEWVCLGSSLPKIRCRFEPDADQSISFRWNAGRHCRP